MNRILKFSGKRKTCGQSLDTFTIGNTQVVRPKEVTFDDLDKIIFDRDTVKGFGQTFNPDKSKLDEMVQKLKAFATEIKYKANNVPIIYNYFVREIQDVTNMSDTMDNIFLKAMTDENVHNAILELYSDMLDAYIKPDEFIDTVGLNIQYTEIPPYTPEEYQSTAYQEFLATHGESSKSDNTWLWIIGGAILAFILLSRR